MQQFNATLAGNSEHYVNSDPMITNLPGEFPWSQKAKYSEKGFLRLVVRHARKAGLAANRDLSNQIARHAADIFERNGQSIVDEPSQFHLLLTSYLLSAVEILEGITTKDEAQAIVRSAFIENGRIWIALSIRTGMLLARDKFGYILESSGQKVVEAYGKGFDIEVETDNSTYQTARVKKCGFHEFFLRNGRPELTKLMCDWDNNWSDTLKNSRHVRFNRPTTIASGDESCDFQFKKKC